MRQRQREKYRNWCTWYMRLVKYQGRVGQDAEIQTPESAKNLYARRNNPYGFSKRETIHEA